MAPFPTKQASERLFLINNILCRAPTLSQLLFDGLRDPTRGVALDRQGALDEVDDVMARALGKAS